jgi:hypothetical protein
VAACEELSGLSAATLTLFKYLHHRGWRFNTDLNLTGIKEVVAIGKPKTYDYINEESASRSGLK